MRALNFTTALFSASPRPTPATAQPSTFKWSGKFTTTDGMPKAPRSCSSAKKAAFRTVFKGHHVTFYCYCAYTARKQVAASMCGYNSPRNNNVRARRIEWEHIVPAAAFGQHRACWKRGAWSVERARENGGADTAARSIPNSNGWRRTSRTWHRTLGRLNADRSNYRFENIPGEPRMYGKRDFEVVRSAKVAEPLPARRGDIARAYLYMPFAYRGGLPLTTAQIKRLAKWHKADPPDAWEKERNKRISQIQGGGNPMVK